MYSDWGIGLERKSDEMGNCGATGFRILCGMTVMYILNRRQRIQEFNKIAEITEDILNERKVQAFSTGEETLYSKLEHQLVRV